MPASLYQRQVMKVSSRQTWDIFCRVIDNYGDIGVCWRLAKQLQTEHGKTVRLWVDDLKTLAPLQPELSTQAEMQVIENIQVNRWREPFEITEVGDVIIEAFACDIPNEHLLGMHQKSLSGTPPVWFNLEYLSAEPWIENCHGLPSPHPQYKLSKTFFFPGLTAKTGGLLREKKLITEKNTFLANQQNLTHSTLRIFLFTYETIPVDTWIEALKEQDIPIEIILPPGKARAALTAYFQTLGQHHIPPNHHNLTFKLSPFVPQSDFDQILWDADLLFIRGEDSFVRAIWSGKPFIWQIYPQEEASHLMKLEAFLEKYTEGLPKDTAQAISNMMLAWNKAPNAPALNLAWKNYFLHFNEIRKHAIAWCEHLSQQTDLTQQLVDLTDNTV